ncbi:hypothetical protein PMAYCL1PPCAC_32792, partial [Pristionchus mayeri]
QPDMLTSLLYLALLPAVTPSEEWLPTCGAAQKQSIHDLVSTDIILRHLNSGVLNSTLTECSNFHRHICPKERPPTSVSFEGLFDQIVAIERSC